MVLTAAVVLAAGPECNPVGLGDPAEGGTPSSGPTWILQSLYEAEKVIEFSLAEAL
jgi:hypothetical protein